MFKSLYSSLGRQYLYWLVFFFICRCIFLFYNLGELQGISFGEIASVFWQALYLDTSMASYLLAFSFLVLSVLGFLPAASAAKAKKMLSRIHTGYVLLITAIFSLIAIAELEIYHEWGTKLNIKALRFLQHPSEVINSTATSFLVFGFLASGLLTFIGFLLYRKLAPLRPLLSCSLTPPRKVLTVFVFILITPGILLLGLRGGIQQIPIQQSDAYFSRYNILNLAAVNSVWNLGQSIWENKKNMEGNPYIYYSFDEARSTVEKLFSVEKDTTISVLTTNRPNVVMVILEGWSADMVKSLGGYDSVAVNFEKLIPQGILFDSAFANGSLSDQGMTCLFSGFPALPSYISIIGQPGKYSHLPCLNTELHQAGYTTSYLFGGQLSYGNIKAYLYYNNFDRILEGKDFDSDIPQGKLGVHDEFLYARQLQELRDEKQPFFASMFTLSSHSPYDMPTDERDKANLAWAGNERRYVSSVRYSDRKLYEFLENAKKEKWFDNTLFVFVSDHSHLTPRGSVPHQPEYRRIPLLLWGNVIREEYRGFRYKKVCSQLDVPATLLNQLGISSSRYKWSKNLFNPHVPQFAFYETFDGFGMVRPNQYLVYAHPPNNFPFEKTISPEEKAKMEKEGKSFLQTMFQDYTDY